MTDFLAEFVNSIPLYKVTTVCPETLALFGHRVLVSDNNKLRYELRLKLFRTEENFNDAKLILAKRLADCEANNL